jgi:hypothetical protein
MPDLVNVFRSADDDAEQDANRIADALRAEGIDATVLDDEAPGVPEGAWEVQVASGNAARAEEIIAAMSNEEEAPPDRSHDLDLVTVFRTGDGSLEGEMEALTVKNLLEAAGIYAVLVGGDVPIPSLGQEVRVAEEHAEEARRVIAEARASGAAAAAEDEAETESSS